MFSILCGPPLSMLYICIESFYLGCGYAAGAANALATFVMRSQDVNVDVDSAACAFSMLRKSEILHSEANHGHGELANWKRKTQQKLSDWLLHFFNFVNTSLRWWLYQHVCNMQYVGIDRKQCIEFIKRAVRSLSLSSNYNFPDSVNSPPLLSWTEWKTNRVSVRQNRTSSKSRRSNSSNHKISITF